MNDIWAMIWNETKGSVLQDGRTAAIRLLLAIGILGLLLPWLVILAAILLEVTFISFQRSRLI